MTDPIDVLRAIYRDAGEFSMRRGEESEADTRANILDRIVHEVLLWPRTCVKREAYSAAGYLDYALDPGRPTVVIEAKASGRAFTLPYSKRSTAARLKIGGVLRTNRTLFDSMQQAQRYCIDVGARFGVATNGYSFVLFQAMVDGESWKERDAIVFESPKVVEGDFATFANLLSYEAVRDGKLAETFRRSAPRQREYHRPIATIVNADATYERNPINVVLRPYVERFFGDIASQDEVDLLERCYVQSAPIQVIDRDLDLVIRDRVPGFAAGATQIETDEHDAQGEIGSQIRNMIALPDGFVALLMGGIGAGKTTFIRRFFRIVAKDLVEAGGPAILVHIDFLGAPDSCEGLDAFLWESAAGDLRDKDRSLEERTTLVALCERQLSQIGQIFRTDPEELGKRENQALFEFIGSPKAFASGALAYYRSVSRTPIVVFDNVDQLGIAQQVQIFTTAEYFAHHLKCISILVMREESYCVAQLQRQLTAYTIRPYHLSSPRFREVVKERLDYSLYTAAHSQESAGQASRETVQEILDFFRMLRYAIFERNRNIVRLVEAVSFGNMRLALELFNTFITSGATNTPEILQHFRDEGMYVVPFHQFAKSLILGDYRYYKESRSHIANVFDVSPSTNASHFTALRLLRYCSLQAAGRSGAEGFVDLQRPISALVELFDNEQDCIHTIRKLIAQRRQLLELDTRRTDSLDGAMSIRITSAGQYYLHYLVKSMAYLDLVWHDTPIADRGLADCLARDIGESEMQIRFKRVDRFLEYLNTAEGMELEEHGLPYEAGDVASPLMRDIQDQVGREKNHIAERFRLLGIHLDPEAEAE